MGRGVPDALGMAGSRDQNIATDSYGGLNMGGAYSIWHWIILAVPVGIAAFVIWAVRRGRK